MVNWKSWECKSKERTAWAKPPWCSLVPTDAFSQSLKIKYYGKNTKCSGKVSTIPFPSSQSSWRTMLCPQHTAPACLPRQCWAPLEMWSCLWPLGIIRAQKEHKKVLYSHSTAELPSFRSQSHLSVKRFMLKMSQLSGTQDREVA